MNAGGIAALVNTIAASHFANVFNPWSDDDPLDLDGPLGRRLRLHQHFTCKPRFLLIGEAPGYQGCHFSGVPFTNERLILEGKIPRVVIRERFTSRPKPWSEPSATVVWSTLHELGIAADVVLWNAFAFHPHKPGEPYSNRTPTSGELRAGLPILKAVVEHFAGAVVVAIGNKARETLSSLGVFCSGHVRHPSMGGATQFREGLRRLVAADDADRRKLGL